MKKNVLMLLILLSVQVTFSQVYHSYLQLDGRLSNPVITDFERMPNNNMVYSLILNDSAKTMPGNVHIYNETVVKNPGSGVLVMSPNNTVLWSHTWMPVNYLNDFMYIYQTLVDGAGNIYLSGRYRGLIDMDPTNGVSMFQQTNANDVEGFLIKLDGNGNFKWAKKFGNTNIAGMYCDLYLANHHPNGQLVFGGSFRKTVDFDPSVGNNLVNANCYHNNAFFLTLDNSGNYVDVKTLQVDSSASLSHFAIDSLGNYYAIYAYFGTIDVDPGPGVVNYTLQSGYYNYCIAKYDANFVLQWSKNFPNDNNFSLKLCLKDNQSFYLFSSFTDTIQLSNNTTAIANGPSDFFVEKWDANGNCSWSKIMSGNGADNIYDVAFKNNKLYYLYAYSDSIHTNTGANDTTLYANKRDMALSVFTENGMHMSSAEVKSDSSVYAEWAKLRLYDNEIYFNFSSNGISDINPSMAVQNVSPTWSAPYTTIALKWILTPTAIQSYTVQDQHEMKIWPNPSSEYFNIETPTNGLLMIYDAIGNKKYEGNTLKPISILSFKGYAKGIYFVYFVPDGNAQAIKMAKLLYQP